MHYLIDGHNLIAHLTDIELEDPNDEVKLILMLRSWAAAGRRRHLTLYFDGGLPGGKSHEYSSGPVEVIFAPPGRPADDLLAYQVRQAENPEAYTLVTSDQQIIAVARRRRMPVLTSETFARRLEKERVAREQAARPDDGSNPVVSASEVNEWLDLFGPEPEPPARPATQARRKKEQEQPAAAPEKKPPRPERELKTSGDLTDEEIAHWLDLFRSGDSS